MVFHDLGRFTMASSNPPQGNRRLLRRLLAAGPAQPGLSEATGTRPLSIEEYPGAYEVARATTRALIQLGKSSPELDTRILFGTQRSMILTRPDTHREQVVETRVLLPQSLPTLVTGASTLASDREARILIQTLDLDPSATLVYLFPLMPNDAFGGVIIAATNTALTDPVQDALLAIGSQANTLMETVQAVEVLRQREAGYRALVQNSSDILLVIHPNMTIVDLAPTAAGMLGYATDELLGRSLASLLDPRDVNRAQLAIQRFVQSKGTSSSSVHWRMRRKNGTLLDVEVVGNNLIDDPGVAGIVLSARDVSERKALEASMLHQVLHDDLTGLPNRAAFTKILEAALARTTLSGHAIAVLFLDLDRFKVVNDSLGHEAGDRLLVQVARRLRESVRPEDTVARLSGDEFVVLVDNIVGPEPAIAIAEKIINRIKEAIRIGTHEVFVSTSIGITIEGGGHQHTDTTTILRNADLAMYDSKNRGRCRYSIYQPAMTKRAIERLELETELRHAISSNQFQVYYQPLIDLRSGRVNEVEALVRWQHPTRGLLMPDTFIGIAEETGLIGPIGQWVLEEACRQGRRWQKERGNLPPLNLSVNLSVRQFQQRELVSDVKRVLQETGINPGQLTLEITESVALDDADAAVATMRELKKLGIQLALDDFGTAYSALSYLKRFPVDSLKIDRSFVEGINQDHGDMAIVKAVIAFAKTLNLRVTAEGVENVDQLRQLKLLGCDLGQGYFFATPLPSRELTLDTSFETGRLPSRDGGPETWSLPIPNLA